MKLNIGSGETKIDGFTNVDKHYKDVNLVSDMGKLPYANHSIEAIYASHCLYYHKLQDIKNTLKEWYRVMDWHGDLYLAVLDFDAIIELYNKNGKVMDRAVLAFLHGMQRYSWMTHMVSFNFNSLKDLLKEAHFKDIKRVERFPLNVDDCSLMIDSTYHIPMSLNVMAKK